MRRRDIRNNLIISGIIEERDESSSDCKVKVVNFFKEQMQIDEEINIEYAKCIGQNKKERPILVRLVNVTDKSIIFSHV